MGRIIEKYKQLNDACKKYPRIQLSNKMNVVPKDENEGYAKDGFIKVFCLTEESKTNDKHKQ